MVLSTILIGLALVVPPATAATLMRPRYAAILMDARTGEVLYANAADEARHPASITKVMTLFLAFDELVAGRLRLTDPIVMSRHAASQRPSKLGLAPGRSISLDDAIHIITVKSANDVAVALGERIGGSERAFAQMMTRKARALGMRNTTFTNATGLPDAGNVTTARDIAILSAALLRSHPSYYTYFGQQAFKYDSRFYTNHNRLLGKLTGLDGIKTGFTNDAGYTLAASAIRNGQRLITVVLGEPSIPARNRDVTALLDAGFTVLERRRAGEETTVAFNLPTLNHPALRLANAGEMGSRTDPATFRRQLAAPLPMPAFEPAVAKARVTDREVASGSTGRRGKDRPTARSAGTAKAGAASKSGSKFGKSTQTAKASGGAKGAAHTASSDKATAKAAGSRKSESAAKSSRASKSASAEPATKLRTVKTAEAASRTERNPIDDWNAKFKSPRSGNP
jgi:D-alanyl-D-alanine carboxypeptidase